MIPLDALLAVLPDPPAPAALEAARRADLRADWATSEAQRARAQRLDTVAEAHDRQARQHRAEALRVLGLR